MPIRNCIFTWSQWKRGRTTTRPISDWFLILQGSEGRKEGIIFWFWLLGAHGNLSLYVKQIQHNTGHYLREQNRVCEPMRLTMKFQTANYKHVMSWLEKFCYICCINPHTPPSYLANQTHASTHTHSHTTHIHSQRYILAHTHTHKVQHCCSQKKKEQKAYNNRYKVWVKWIKTLFKWRKSSVTPQEGREEDTKRKTNHVNWIKKSWQMESQSDTETFKNTFKECMFESHFVSILYLY